VTWFLRLSGLAAIAGGVLRIADSFTTHALSPDTLTVLYFVTDVLLLAGIASIWWKRRRSLSIAVFVIGILMIRASAFGIGGYQLGATVALLGLAGYSLMTLVRRSGAPWAPAAWLIALGFGIAGTLGFAPQAMTIAAGVAFGAGFIAAGGEVLATAQGRLSVRRLRPTIVA
jgi:hypothetical protein